MMKSPGEMSKQILLLQRAWMHALLVAVVGCRHCCGHSGGTEGQPKAVRLTVLRPDLGVTCS